MLRRARVEDANGIHSVHMTSIRALAASTYTTEQIDAWCGNRGPDDYVIPISEKTMFVIDLQGQIAGFSQFDQSEGVVEAVYVQPTLTRQGLGTGLLKALEAVAKELGFSYITLNASLNAVAFYENAGYVPVESRKHSVSAGIELECMNMSRRLVARSGA